MGPHELMLNIDLPPEGTQFRSIERERQLTVEELLLWMRSKGGGTLQLRPTESGNVWAIVLNQSIPNSLGCAKQQIQLASDDQWQLAKWPYIDDVVRKCMHDIDKMESK